MCAAQLQLVHDILRILNANKYVEGVPMKDILIIIGVFLLLLLIIVGPAVLMLVRMRKQRNSLPASNASEALSRSKEKNKSKIKKLTPQEQRIQEQAANDQTVISACGLGGAALFFILNITTGVVPGGWTGGAIGGGLGAVVGLIINSFRRRAG